MKTFRFVLLIAILMACAILQAKTVGVLWVGKSGMAETILKNFQASLNKLDPSIKVEVQKDLPDMKKGEEVYMQFQQSKDAVVWLRSNGAEFMAKHPPKIPGFVGACNNPQSLGVVSKLAGAPDKNITGVTYYVPTEAQLKVFKQIFPQAKTYGFIFENGHPGSAIEKEEIEELKGKMGYGLKLGGCAKKDDLAAKTREVAAGADIIILSASAMMSDNIDVILANAGAKPVVSFEEKAIKGGAVGGLVADNDKLGGLLANSVHDVLVKGKSVAQVTVKMDPTPKLFVNRASLEKAKITIPQGLLGNVKMVN